MSEDAPATITEVITLARAAQAQWSAVPVCERAMRLRPLRARALARAEQIARAVHQETGKPETEALLAEVLAIADLVDYWTRQIEVLLEPDDIELDPLVYSGKSGRVERVPRGVVALITPWSFPVVIPMRHIIPAILTGNAVIFQPSELTPAVNEIIQSLFEDLLPPNLLRFVDDSAKVGHTLIQAGVDAVAFTGDVSSGRKIAIACAERFTPCSLELGGNDAAIVLADARIERTAQGIVWGAFNNAGQNGASIQRVYVVRTIADALIQRVVAITQQLCAGQDIGPLTTQAQCDIVDRQLTDALEHGAEVLTGGAHEPGSSVFPPTVVQVNDPRVALVREKSPGPILPIVVVEDEAQAVTLANDTTCGLTASIWTRRIAKGRALARRLRAGVVTINNHGFTAALPMAPWSGVGDSGDGVANGPHALAGYTRPRFILTDRRRASHERWWFPYNDTVRGLALQTARMRGGAGFFGRIAAFFALLFLLPKRRLRK